MTLLTDSRIIDAPILSPTPSPESSRFRRIVRGPLSQPAWTRPAAAGLLLATAVLYLWQLSASGWANSFYAAATQAGSQSWKAWFFGSLDSGSSITVDKPPAFLWVTGLSARLFGFNSWSLLVPQALEGVAAVGLLYAAVKRISGPVAGLIAGAVLALTPAAVLMFRFDNPDALLTLLMVAGAYAVVRATSVASWRWLALAGVALGFAFLTKMLQGFLVLPAFVLVYLLAAPTSLRRRVVDVLLAGAALLVAGGWWVLAVALWPASSRPYIGGSTNNSVLDLVFGYNGFGRLLGGSGNGGGGGGTAGSSFGGATGLGRLFGSEMGNEISWLLPAALVALVAGLALTWRRARTDQLRASVLLWGGWLLVTGVVFSYMKGTIHPYYTVALAPAIAGLVALVGVELWRVRSSVAARVALAVLVTAAGGWSFELLGRVSSWQPALRYLVLLATVVAVFGLLVPLRSLARVGAVAALVAGLVGTASFGLATAATPHTGSIPSVGPSAAQTGSMGGMGMGTRGGGSGSGMGTPPPGSGPSGGSAPSGSSTSGASVAGGSAGGAATSSALTTALKAATTKWAAAVAGDQSAAELELASGKAVIAIGGWSGSDNSPTLAQFEAYVAAGQIRYYISGGGTGGGPGGSSGSAGQIATWVASHYSSMTIGGQTVYDLSKANS